MFLLRAWWACAGKRERERELTKGDQKTKAEGPKKRTPAEDWRGSSSMNYQEDMNYPRKQYESLKTPKTS